MPSFTVDMVEEELAKQGGSLKGATVALLGLSYKSNISDVRESPSFEIEDVLKERGADVRAYDPYVRERSNVKTLSEALSGARAAIVATGHKDFMTIPPHRFKEYGVQVVVDGRNCLDKEALVEAGLAYRGIGR